MRLSFTAFLPIALTGMVISTSSVNADEGCQAAYDAYVADAGDSCAEVDGMCPDTCQELVTTLDSACAGKSYTVVDRGEEVYGQAETVFSLKLSIDGACEYADLIPGETTCSEAFFYFSLFVLGNFSCARVDGKCSSYCQDLATDLESACAGGQSYTVDGESTKYNQGDAADALQLAEGACGDAISGATILGTHASATLITGSIAAVISSFLFL